MVSFSSALTYSTTHSHINIAGWTKYDDEEEEENMWNKIKIFSEIYFLG